MGVAKWIGPATIRIEGTWYASPGEYDMKTRSGPTRTALGAGKWFPGTRQALGTTVTNLMEEAFAPEVEGTLIGAISPHAGYPYSGPVAATLYRAIRDNAAVRGAPDTVIVLGFSHRGEAAGVALMDGDAFATPLAETPLDVEAATFLLGAEPRVSFDYRPHMGEHSLENQVPFIQAALPSASLVMALIGPRDPSLLDALAVSLGRLANQKKILVIASSDMLHDPSYELVRKTDQATLRRVTAMDTVGILRDWDYDRQIFCGIAPVVTAMKYARTRGCTKATLLRYRNSGDDYPESRGQWVVGYGAVGFAV